MPELGRYARHLRSRLWKVPVEQEVDSELAYHLEMRAQEYIAQGMSPERARAEALRRFGDLGEISAECRDQGRRRDEERRRAEWLGELRQDARYALRYLRGNPGFTAVAVLTLALGIGASATIFGVADAVLLRPLPYPQPERLARLSETNPSTEFFAVSEPNYLDWRVRNRSFAELAAFYRRGVSLLGSGEPEQLVAAAATPTLFGVMGVPPLVGRTFTAEEGRPGAAATVAVLAHGLWQRRFGGDPGIVGRTVSLNGTSHQVVGVMPAGFDFPGQVELWLPFVPSPESSRGDHRMGVMGRLRPGVSAEQALQDMRAVGRQLAKEYPETNAEWGANVVPLQEWIVGPELRRRVVVLLVAVGLVLLMACVNVANLLLARGGTRQREISVRAALGAGRGRIVRQLLTESLVLALLGAVVGVAFTAAAVPVLREAGESSVPRLSEMRMDWRVLAFGIGASLLTGLLFGLVPAVQASRQNLHDLLRGGARVAGAARLRGALVVGSVALAMVLLVGAGLVGGSFRRLMGVDPGFRAAGVLVGSVSLPRERYDSAAKMLSFHEEALRRVAAIPGVRSVGLTNILPYAGGNTAISFTVVGREPASPDEYLEAAWRSVTPGLFATLQVPLRRGRLPAETDVREGPAVIAISETMARRLWPGADPIGQQIRVSGDSTPWTVVGVVGDVRDRSLDQEPDMRMYLSYRQVVMSSMWLMVRTTGDPMAVAGPLRREIAAVDKDLPVANLQPLAELETNAAAQPRLTMLIFILFAAAALTLAVVGVYGVVAYGVTQRTREIGVRLALGARPRQIVGDVVRRGVVLAGVGIAGGLAAAWAMSRFVAGILYGIEATDVATYAAVALVLAAAAAAASLLPARSAARLDPVLALRSE